MTVKPSSRNSLEWLNAGITCLLLAGVIYTFVVGRHFIIPTIILSFAVLFANLSFYAFKGRLWAKLLTFWLYLLLSCHLFFALFWAQKYRQVLQQAFEPACIIALLLLVFLLVKYQRSNHLFTDS
jgi:hypothetical protein